MILLVLWRWAGLTFPGAYIHGEKKARINIKVREGYDKGDGAEVALMRSVK